jgi:hypothetical protein
VAYEKVETYLPIVVHCYTQPQRARWSLTVRASVSKPLFETRAEDEFKNDVGRLTDAEFTEIQP